MPTHARERAFLESVAKRRILITYQELANALQILPPHSIHRVTEALERLMEEDAAADRPFIGAWRSAGARVLRLRPASRQVRGRSARQDARTFHAAELNAVLACWSGATTNNEDIMLTDTNPAPSGGSGLSRSPPTTTV